MIFKSMEIKHIKIPLHKPVAHNLATYTHSESLIVKLKTEDGTVGWGEARPRPYLTGETLDSAKETGVRLFQESFANKKFKTFQEVKDTITDLVVQRENLSALCGLDLALLDAAGKKFNIFIGDVLGLVRNKTIPKVANISMDYKTDNLKKVCIVLKLKGYQKAKVKVGLEDDFERLEIIRNTLGQNFFLWADANCAWKFEEAKAVKINNFYTFGSSFNSDGRN